MEMTDKQRALIINSRRVNCCSSMLMLAIQAGEYVKNEKWQREPEQWQGKGKRKMRRPT